MFKIDAVSTYLESIFNRVRKVNKRCSITRFALKKYQTDKRFDDSTSKAQFALQIKLADAILLQMICRAS